MTPADIRNTSDRNPDLTLAQLSKFLGLTVLELKEILLITPAKDNGQEVTK